MKTKQKTNAELMRAWRKLMGYNTAQAGEALDLSPRAIEDIEQGRRRADDALTHIALDALINDVATVEAVASRTGMPRVKKLKKAKNPS